MATKKQSSDKDAKVKKRQFVKRPRIVVEFDKLHNHIIAKIQKDLPANQDVDQETLSKLVRENLGYFHPVSIKWICDLLNSKSTKIPKNVLDEIKSKNQEIIDLKNEISTLTEKLKLHNI